MIIAIDVHYRQDFAKAVLISFSNWEAEKHDELHEVIIDEVAEYEPGLFYKRELPCILKVLEKIDLNKVALIIVDSFVFLDDQRKPGLGAYLYDALDQCIPIIGVAKKAFKNNKQHIREVLRGDSQKPLYVSAVGYDVDLAASNVKVMKGKYRMPDLLKLLDTNTKA